MSEILDWTRGTQGISYQRCVSCQSIWYMQRDFCPGCGQISPPAYQASGRGVVYAITVVTRAPSEALRSYAPYTVVLVDCVEGFRVMAHGSAGLRIGDAVRARFIEFGGHIIPSFLAENDNV